jgi:hypothetical protein
MGHDGFYFSSEEGVLRIFFVLKNPTASAGFEPANLGTKGQHATSRKPKPLTSSLLHCHYDFELRHNFCIWYFGGILSIRDRWTCCTDCSSSINFFQKHQGINTYPHRPTFILHCFEFYVNVVINVVLLDHVHIPYWMLLLLLWLEEVTVANSIPRPSYGLSGKRNTSE